MEFCDECNNLLYPKEERSEKKLYYKCRNCNFQKPASEVRVYSNDVKSAASALHIVSNKEITMDPTLPRSREQPCSKCHQNESVYFQPSEEQMSLVFVCCNQECSHWWRMDEVEEHKQAL